MSSRILRGAMALFIALTAATAGLAPRLPWPSGHVTETALAANNILETCTEADFDTSLQTVESDGGGAIGFDCSGTIAFTTEKTITTSITLIGNGQVIFDGGDNTRLFNVTGDATFRVVNLTFQNGNTAGGGGAIRTSADSTLIVIASTFAGNVSIQQSGDSGGAILNQGRTTIIGSNFTNNTGRSGGAISSSGWLDEAPERSLTVIDSTFTNNAADVDLQSGLSGGAIHNVGTLSVSGSTFTGNYAQSNTEYEDGRGGAIYTDVGPATVTNSTFQGNTVTGTGGAIFFFGSPNQSSSLAVRASTIISNNAGEAGGGISVNNGSPEILSTIIANNAAPEQPNCRVSIFGAFTSLGYNLVSDGSCPFSNAGDLVNNPNINLGPLADNGGPTWTMRPQASSAALDNGSCAASSTDQRGAPRPASGCDIGSVEAGAGIATQIIAGYGFGYEGNDAMLYLTAYGANNSNLDYAIDCDNDNNIDRFVSGAGTTLSTTCRYHDDGTYTPQATVCNGGSGTNCDFYDVTVYVENLAPSIVSVSDNGPVDEGSPVTLSVTASDPAGANDPLTYAFDCDNNGSFETAGTGNQGSCTFDIGGPATIGI